MVGASTLWPVRLDKHVLGCVKVQLFLQWSIRRFCRGCQSLGVALSDFLESEAMRARYRGQELIQHGFRAFTMLACKQIHGTEISREEIPIS
jgi:hypothetical protein